MSGDKLLFMARNKKMITTVNGTDNNKETLNIFKEKIKGNDRDMQQEINCQKYKELIVFSVMEEI